MGRDWFGIRVGGVVAFHDIVPGPSECVGGVPRFWREIKRKFRHTEIVESWGQGGYGIGVNLCLAVLFINTTSRVRRLERRT